jgi:HEAT repeat protein
MLVGMLWRLQDPDPVPALNKLARDPDCAFNAMAALRRKVSASEARVVIEPLLSDPDVRVRNAARENIKRIDKRLRQEADSSR